MSCSEDENAENEKHSKKPKFALHKLKEIKKFEVKELFAYVEKLHGLIRKNGKKLKKYKERVKKLLKQVDELKEKENKAANVIAVATPKEANEEQPEPKSVVPTKEEEEELAASEAFSFVAEIRQAAEQAQNLNGFVYEPTSGLYYDQKTGYYYNAEYGLYYDGNNGCYYSYDREKNTFEFHSQVPVQPNKTAKQTNSNNDVFENYVNNSLLKRFSNLKIDRMRNNALGKSKGQNADDNVNDDDVDNVEVAFDEFGGVIADVKQLQHIKEAKEESRREKEKHKKQKKPTKHTSQPRKHKSKKRKRNRRDSPDSDSYNSDAESRSIALKKKRQPSQDFEDGELSNSSSNRSSSDNETNSQSGSEVLGKQSKAQLFKSGSRFQDIAKKYPPSLRIVVQDTNLEQLKVGSLHLITFKGGSLGREGDHDVIIPDVNVSKYHLKFHYDTKQSVYKCTDLGSRNGTVLNGTRMSVSKTESDALDLVHGSVLQIAQTKLLCHVHKGNSTCGLCEPGLLIETLRETIVTTSVSVALTHKEQLKKLQKKYGLEHEKFVDGKQGAGNYNDRAATRRIKVGSSTDKEKTQMASVNTEISSENKGFKMLAKLGWNKGEALGKSNVGSGLLEPINVSTNEGKKGLGCAEATGSVGLTFTERKKIDTWKKTQERYQKATDIFGLSGDDSS